MKKLMITGVLALMGMFAMAQPAPEVKDPETAATRMTERMTQELTLSEEQVETVYQINLDFAREMKSGEADRKALRDTHHDKLSEVLTAEQLEKLDRLVAKRRQMHKRGHHERESAREDMRVE